MRLKIILLLLAVTAAGLCGCRRETHTLAPFGWSPVGEPFDSLTVVLDWKFLNIDTTGRPIEDDVADIERLAQADPTSSIKRARALYQRARLDWRYDRDEAAMKGFRDAIALIDSARYPYDLMRIRWHLEPTPAATVSDYLRISREIGFFESVGDRWLAGDKYIQLGTLLNEVGDFDRGMTMLDRADSLLTILHDPAQRRIVLNNRVNALFQMGRRDEGERLFRTMLADPLLRGRSRLAAYCNLYYWTGDTAALHAAYAMALPEPSCRDLWSLLASHLSREELNAGLIDSAMRHDRLAMSHIGADHDPEHLPLILSNHASLMEATGHHDSAYIYLSRAKALSDSLSAAGDRRSIMNAETARKIVEAEWQSDRRHNRHILWTICVISATLLAAGAASLLLYRRMQRQRIAKMQAELRLEASQRKVLAMQLALQEKDSLLDLMNHEMSALTAEGEISPSATNRIKSSIRTHLSANDERSGFIETFSAINPNFATRLKERWPALTDADIRFASFIALGLDNKHIARILSIRAESVKQARWRMRQKLGLPSGESIDELLKSFLDQ